jgi:hypothetical protein
MVDVVHVRTLRLCQSPGRYQRIATTMTSGGNRNPANADTVGDQPERAADLIDEACLDHLTDERNSAVSS